MIKDDTPAPKVTHMAGGRTVNDVTRLVRLFVDRKVIPEITRKLPLLINKWDNPDTLLDWGKKLLDEVKTAFYGRDDRVHDVIVEGKTLYPDRGHEAAMVLYAAIIDYLMDEDLRAELDSWGI